MNILFAFSLVAALARAHTPLRASCVYTLGGITYRVPRLGARGFTLRPGAGRVNGIVQSDPQTRSIGEVFRFDGLTRGFRPLSVFKLQDEAAFSRAGATDVLDLMIKSPGLDYVIPDELAQFKEALQRIITLEHLINPRARDDYYAYVTIDQSAVEAGVTQRLPGWQLDGFQGTERNPRQEIDHSYLVSDHLPEVFTTQRFYFPHFDYQLHNVFSELDRQASPEFELRGDPYQVYLVNAYTAHRSPVAEGQSPRTYLRLTYSRARYDKLGSTDNSLLPYAWDRPEKTLRQTLAKYVPSVGSQLLTETRTFDQVRGARLGLVSLGGADARVAAHVAEMLIANGRQIEFVASVRASLPYEGGMTLDEDVIHLDRTFRPLAPIAEMAFAERLPTYLMLQRGDLKSAFRTLLERHAVDGVVIVNVGGRGLSPRYAQDTPLIEHRLQEAVQAQDRSLAPERTVVVVAPGYGLPPDAGTSLFQKARRYKLTQADRLRVQVSAAKWDQVLPRPGRHEVSAQMWRQAVADRFGAQDFPGLNPHDPPIEIKPEHQDLLFIPLDDVVASSVRRIR